MSETLITATDDGCDCYELNLVKLEEKKIRIEMEKSGSERVEKITQKMIIYK